MKKIWKKEAEIWKTDLRRIFGGSPAVCKVRRIRQSPRMSLGRPVPCEQGAADRYPFGSSADSFSQDPTFTAPTFQNEPTGKRHLIKWNPKLIKKGANESQHRPKMCKGAAQRASMKLVTNKTFYSWKNMYLLTKRQMFVDFGCHLGPRWTLKRSPNR